MRISLETARKLAIHAQGLDGRWKLPAGKEGVAELVERLGYVQIDTIAVIQRAHDHTLWTRRSDYDAQMLGELLAEDRRVFEYWTHAASYVPFRHFRYYIARMKGHARSEHTRQWRKENAEHIDEVLGRIRAEGALGSADFKSSRRSGPWWGWKPAKRALESLFHAGELMVTARRNFQRLYDLPERVIPDHIDTTEPTADERNRFFVRQTLAARGIVTADQIRAGHRQFPAAREILDELIDADEVSILSVRGIDEPFYALDEILKRRPRTRKKRLHILSPFDSLVIDCRRLVQKHRRPAGDGEALRQSLRDRSVSGADDLHHRIHRRRLPDHDRRNGLSRMML